MLYSCSTDIKLHKLGGPLSAEQCMQLLQRTTDTRVRSNSGDGIMATPKSNALAKWLEVRFILSQLIYEAA